jgi:predicted DNA binding CopG/RHH family protein
MAKKRSASSAPAKPRDANVKYLPDSELDLIDIPEMTDEQLKRGRRVGRPKTGHAKHLIAIRVSPSVLYLLRRQAEKCNKPYQTYIHEILERAAKKSAA